CGSLVEVDRILVRSVERLSGLVCEVQRINSVFRQVRYEAEMGDNRSLEIVIAVDAHCIGIHRPTVDDARYGRQLPVHELLPGLRGRIERSGDDRIDLCEVERLAGLDAQLLHLREDRLVRDVRRLLAHYSRPKGKKTAGGNRSSLL